MDEKYTAELELLKKVTRFPAKSNFTTDINDLKNLDSENELIITNIRHKDLINKAKNGLVKANNTVKEGLPVDMISINIQEAIKDLCEILGESISEDVLNRIFEKFCVGK